jgi:hypothetical protein
MRPTPLTTATVAALLLLPGFASAATRYVAVGGKDSNPGTINKPFATLNRACSASAPGDTVLVRGGIYYQRASLSCSGTASARLSFRPYPGESAVIDGSRSEPDKSLIGIYGHYIDFEGFEVRNATRTGISAWGVNSLRIAGNAIHDCELGGIWVGHDQPDANTDITVENNVIYATGKRFYPHTTTSGWPSAISVGSTAGGVVRGNDVHHNHGEGIGVGHSHFVDLIDNRAHDNYSTNLYLDNMQDAIVSGNFVYTTRDPAHLRYGLPANGISIANEQSSHSPQDSARLQLINNIVEGGKYGIYYGNFQLGTGLHDSLIAHNTIYQADDTSLRIDNAPHTNTRFTQNIVVAMPGQALASVAGSGLLFARNGWHGGSAGAAAGVDDINADPLFELPGVGNPAGYRLSTASPMGAAGSLLAEVGIDYDHAIRSAPTSLGAMESP